MSGYPAPEAALAYRPDVDGLRAVAVTVVVAFHAYRTQLTGGFIGVDVFFVISGYLISGIIQRDLALGRFSMATFYGRRIRRLFPALIPVLLACLGLGAIILLPQEFAALGEDTAWSAGFLGNILLLQQAGYFDRSSLSKPLLHLWSLGVEEQFYILWPPALWAIQRCRVNWTGCLLAVIAASFVLNLMLDPAVAFYLPFTRFWEFAAGAIAARLAPASTGNRTRSAASFTGLGLIAFGSVWLTDRMAYPSWLAVIPVLGAVLIIAAGHRAWPNRVLLSNRAAVSLGLISYPLYLWHWPLIAGFTILHLGRLPREVQALGLIAASVVLAAASWRWLERPMRHGGALGIKTAVLAVSMAVTAATGVLVWRESGFPERYPPLPDVSVDKINAAITDGIFRATRDMTLRNDGIVRIAEIGTGARTVLFTGDSLLFQFGPRVQALFSQGRLDHHVVFVVGPSCPPIPNIERQGSFAPCAAMPDVAARLIESSHAETVVLGGYWQAYTGPGNMVNRKGSRLPTGTPAGDDAVWANLRDEVSHLAAEGRSVYLVLPTPGDPRFAPGHMITRSLSGVWVDPQVRNGVPMADMQARNADAVRRLKAIAAETGAKLLDPFPDACGAGRVCAAFFGDGDPKFTDEVHMRPAFVETHIHFLDSILTR